MEVFVLPVIEFLADIPALTGTEIDLVAVTEFLTLAVVDDVLKASTGVDGHVFRVGFALGGSGGGDGGDHGEDGDGDGDLHG